MIQTIFEEMGGTYSRHGDYLLPNLLLLQEEESTEAIGTWGRQHLAYIRHHKQVHYTNLLTSGKLHSYLADIDKRATDFYFRAVTALAEQEGVTEQLKAENQMLWVQKMNNIDSRKSSSRSRTRVWRSNQPTSAPFYLPCQNRAKMARSCAKKD